MNEAAGMFTIDATNLHRLMNCNGSRIMPAAFPSVDDDPSARDEGTAAHWAAQQWFNGVDPDTLLNGKAPNGVIMTAEMLEHVGSYLNALDAGDMEVVTTFGDNATWQVNARADHISYRDGVLTVDDFKYGWSIVEPDDNWTLIAHAVGWSLQQPLERMASEIVLRIHQPRPYHPDGKLREWRISGRELQERMQAIRQVMVAPSDELRTGLDWCRKCHALATCPAARRARMNIIDASAMAFSDDLPNDALAYELSVVETAAAMLNAQLDALKELTMHRLKDGAIIENYAVEPQYANTRWKTGMTAEALTLASGIDCSKVGAVTPGEAKRRGMPDAVIKMLTERPMTGTKLVRVSADKRAQRLLNGRKV